MLHLQPVAEATESAPVYAEAVARLASIRHALRLVDPHGGGPADDCDRAINAGWNRASGSARRCFDRGSERVVASTAAGLEALLAEREAGREPNAAASARLAEDIRRGLEDVSRLMLA